MGSGSASDFRTQLAAALNRAAAYLPQELGDERIYAFSLYTSGEEEFSYVCASANTEEGLRAKSRKYAKKHPEYAGEAGVKKLRWSVPDWTYHNFSAEVEALELPGGQDKGRDNAIYGDFIHCLRKLRKTEAFRAGDPGVVFLVTCGDMSEEFFLKGLKRLNPPEIVDWYVKEFTAAPYLDWLRSLNATDPAHTLGDLYRDLNLDIPSAAALDARARHVDGYDLEPLIADLGADGISLLLDLMERFGFGKVFNEKGTAAFERYGAFTPEANLATSAAFLIAQCRDITEPQIRRMQEILRKRVEIDRIIPLTSTLAENIARVLHHLRPKRFPSSQLNPKTNHLDNPDPFL